MAVFNNVPDFGAQKQLQPRVSNIQFGDGYSQRVANGINTQPETWNLLFSNRDESEASSIDDFLKARNGVESFDWTPPGASTARKFICQTWSLTSVKYNLYSISATFVEVFDL